MRKRSPAVDHPIKCFSRLWIVLDRVDIRASQNQLRVEVRLHFSEARETPHYARGILQRVPSGDLNDERSIQGRNRTEPDYIDAAVYTARRPIEPYERRQRLGRITANEPGMEQDRACNVVFQVLVLGREWVDRWGNYRAPVMIADIGNVLLSCENSGSGIADVWRQEVPTQVGLRIRDIGADMTSPDDDCPKSAQRRSESCCLGIVEDYNVSRPDQSADLVRVRTEHVLVNSSFIYRERRAVAV